MTLPIVFLLVALQTAAVSAWTNPLVEQRADPHVSLHGGEYLMTATVPEYDRIELRRAKTLDGLGPARPHVIWRRHASGPMSWHIWAPELHRIDGKWYVYFAAGRAENIWAIRMYVLENASADPFTGTWVEKGQIRTKWETFREIVGHELDNPDRHTRAQPIGWREDGTPDFGVPVADGPLRAITGR